MKPAIFVTYPLFEPVLQKLKAYFEVSVSPEKRTLTQGELIQHLQGKAGVLCLLTDKIDKTVIEACPDLKVISNYAVGHNNIDLSTATAHKMPVYYTPGVLSEATADLTWALILTVTRRVVEADAYLRQGHFKGWAPELLLGTSLQGKTLGIVGMGRIGLAVAERAKAFKMKVIYHATQDKGLADYPYHALEDLLQEADIVSLHLPYHAGSHHLLDAKRLALFKKGAYLINTARGAIVDESALVAALESGHLRGAGLDVFENEPEVHPRLLALPQVVLLPHVGSATEETRLAMGMLAAENLIQAFFGSNTDYLLNPEALNPS